jgi:hypothetical protein
MTTISPTHWDRVAQPILNALAARDGAPMSGAQLEAATGLDKPEMMRALRSLKEASFIDGALMSVGEENYPIEADGIRLLPKGLEHTGQWPKTDWSAVLVAALEQRIREEPDPKERKKLKAVLGAMRAGAGMTLSAVIGNAVAAVMKGIGLG